MAAPIYQFLIFGSPTTEQKRLLTTSICKSLADFSLKPNEHFSISDGIPADFIETNPAVAFFFGAKGSSLREHERLVRINVPVIPMVSRLDAVATDLPTCLHSINVLELPPSDSDLVKPTNIALQCLGLLHSQRRIFISYRRTESRDVAVQLFEKLASRNFDVFLDTHSVGVAVDFQSALWHRLCDSDVLLMLDTPGFFESRWATVEWGRATDKSIAILQVLWPNHTASRLSTLATPMPLKHEDFEGSLLTEKVVDEIAIRVEILRSKSTALRHANIAGHLRAAVESMGGTVEGFGPRRSLSMRTASGLNLVAHPTVGVPSAVTLHEVMNVSESGQTIVVYDHVGISEDWMNHLGWLGSNITSVKWIKSRQAGWELSELEGF